MKFLFIFLFLLKFSLSGIAQKEVDLSGLRQITELYKYIYKEEPFLEQLKKVGTSTIQIEAMREKYSKEISETPQDSIAIEIKNADDWLKGFIKIMKERYSYETVLKEFEFNIHMANVNAKTCLKTSDDPDGKYSMWQKPKTDLMRASIYLELLKIHKGESDTVYQNRVKKMDERAKLIEGMREQGKQKYIKATTFSVPVDVYKGTDKEQIKAKAKELFQKQCSDYVTSKVYITGENWFRNKGSQWDDLSKSFKHYDKSGIEIDIICRKKSEPSSPNGFLVQFNLIKNHISGNYEITVFCRDIEYKKIAVPK